VSEFIRPRDLLASDADVEAVLDCLRSGWLTMGPRTQEFDRALAEWLGVSHAVTVSSATAALHLALLAVGVEPGDHVVIPAVAPTAVASAVSLIGAQVSRADVGGATDLLVDVESVMALVGQKTKAAVVSHVLGLVADVESLVRACSDRGVVVIEDATEALGAKKGGRCAGTTGQAGAFSLGPGSQLVVGDGGVVASSQVEIADRARLLRSHAMTSVTWDRHRGYAETYDVLEIGFNYRLDEVRSALGLSRLATLHEGLERRKRLASALIPLLERSESCLLPTGLSDAGWNPGRGIPVLVEPGAARCDLVARLEPAGLELEPYLDPMSLEALCQLAPGPERARDLLRRLYVIPFRGRALTEPETLASLIGEIVNGEP